MDQPALPLSYYCRSARLCLKKADFARKAAQFGEELQQLKKFETLLLSTIPRHPNYHLNRGESQIEDLQILLVDVEKRVRSLETDMHGRLSPYSGKRPTSKLRTPKSSVKSPKAPRLAEVIKSPKKARKSVKKTASKRRETWEDWSTRITDAGARKRSASPLSRQSPRRKSKSPSRSPRKGSAAGGSRYWEVPPSSRRNCANCGHEHDDEAERDERWRFSTPDPGSGTDRLRNLSKKLLVSRTCHRDSSGSPISRALQPLEDDFINLQALVIELKGSLDGFKLRFDEEGRSWRSRTENLEKDLQYLRHDVEVDMMSVKRNIHEEVKRTLDGLTNDLAAAEDLWALSEAQKKEKLQHVRDESSAKLEDFRDKMNVSFVETKAVLLKGVDDKIANSLSGIKSSLRSDFEILELGIARDVEDLKREMTLKCESFLTEVELAGIGGKQRVEGLIKEALEKFLPQKLDSMVGKERTVTEMKEALCLLWKEVEALSRSKRGMTLDRAEREILREPEEVRRGPIKEAIEGCFPSKFDEATDKSISQVKEELRTLWSEVDSLAKGRKEGPSVDVGETHEGSEQLKKQLQYVRKDAMQARVEVDDVKKEMDVVRRSVGNLEFKVLHVEGLPQLLDNIEETKRKMDTAISFIEKEKNLAVTAATDAASAASKAGQMVEEVIGSVSSEKLNARRKSCEFQESLAHEKDLVAESAGAVLSEVRRKSLHLQESLEQDISRVKESFATEVKRMSMDLNQERECAASEVREFQRSLKDAFAALEKERDAASSAASEITALAEKAEGLLTKFAKPKTSGTPRDVEVKETGFETELNLKGRGEELLRNLTILEARIKHTAGEQLNLSKKVKKMESVQINTLRSLEELRSGACGVESSASSLMPKFENAAVVLKDVERRVGILENPNGRRKKRRVQSKVGGVSFDAKVIMLENRIDHVASATYTNLRVLDAKIEKLSTGVESALDGTTATENKCSALGEEVVRVFRMFLSTRKSKESAEKYNSKSNLTASSTAVGKRRGERWDSSGPGAIQSKCVCCSKGNNRWTSSNDRNSNCPVHSMSGRRGEVRKINVRLGPEVCAVRSESPIHCTIRTSPTKQLRSESPLHCTIRTSSPTRQSSGQNQSGLLEILESEVGQANVEEEGEDDGEAQANFRLESGRIHLNVRHG